MNEYQQNLWDQLMNLVQESEAFYFADQEMDGQKFRIFNYRLASYTDFCKPGALECRGITFAITGEGYDAVPEYLAAMPMEKFFNLYEVSSDINTLAETLVKQGRLSREIYEEAKRRSKEKSIKK